MARVHVVAPDWNHDYEAAPKRKIWLVGRQVTDNHGEDFAEGWYDDSVWINASYDFRQAMDIARELDQQWDPGVENDEP